MNAQEIIDHMARMVERKSNFPLLHGEGAALLAHIRSRESIIEQQKNTIHALTMGLPDHLPKTSTELARYIGNIESELAALKRPMEGEDAIKAALDDHLYAIAGGRMADAMTHAATVLTLYRSALRDANRYRALRNPPEKALRVVRRFQKHGFEYLFEEDLDAAIDSAMEKSNG